MSGTLISYPIENKSDYKAWALDHPNAHRLLREVLFRWRGSNIKKRGWPGHWTVYPLERWAEWAGLSPHQLKRELKRLEVDGLLRRTRGRFQGSTVRSYLQPTALAVDYAGKVGDRDRLGAAYGTEATPANALAIAPNAAPLSAPTSAPTDHTSIPFHPSKASSSTETSGVHSHIGEEGSAGETSAKIELHDDDDLEIVEGIKKLAAIKAKKSGAFYPKLEGKHEGAVRHPEDLYPERWHGFSQKVKARLYARYREYVENWHKAHSAASFGPAKGWTEQTDWSEYSDEDEAALIASYEKKAQAGSGSSG